MTNICILHWNLEKFGRGRANVNYLVNTMADIIYDQNADICIFTELAPATGGQALLRLAQACSQKYGNNAESYFRYYFVSENAGAECYGFLIKDINVVRPLQFYQLQTNPVANLGTLANPLTCLDAGGWKMWPNGWDQILPAQNGFTTGDMLAPVMDLFAMRTNPRLGSAYYNFAGQAMTGGGYAQGSGSRLPALAVFTVKTDNGLYWFPVVALHAAASLGTSNPLAECQVPQLALLHIAQLFGLGDDRADAAGPRQAGYLYINENQQTNPTTGWLPVQNLMVTGDFNLDFNDDADAYNALTTAVATGGSGTPGGAAATAGNAPGATPPVTGIQAPTASRSQRAAFLMSLKTGVTQGFTHLNQYQAGGTNSPFGTVVFDNMFYGGQQLAGAVNPNGGTGDAAFVPNVPAAITAPGGTFSIAGLATSYAQAGVRNANQAAAAPLRAYPTQPMTTSAQLIGARLISDHLPQVTQVTFA